jgi:hypothetical protein
VIDPDVRPPGSSLALVGCGLLLYAVAGAGTALFETLLVPLRHGATLVPIAVPLAIASNLVLPRLARMLNDTAWAAAVPAAAWTAMVVVMLGSRREGDVLVTVEPSDLKYVAYGMFFCGVISAVLTVAMTNHRRPPQRLITGPPGRRDSDIGGVL